MKVQVVCSCCRRTYEREITEVEEYNLKGRQMLGRSFGRAQDILPNIPAWFRSGLLDGFCVCPECRSLVDQSIPCSPDCENLRQDGTADPEKCRGCEVYEEIIIMGYEEE